MATTPRVSVVDERTQTIPERTTSEKEMQVVEEVFHKYRASADDRNRNFAYFDDSNLIDYINDSVRRFVTNIDVREDIEDWQAIIHDPFTRNKVLAVLGKVVAVMPFAEFSGRGDEDCRKAEILNSLYEYAEDVDDYEELMTFFLLEAIVKGTAIGYEGMNKREKKIRIVTKANDEIKITETVEKVTSLVGSVVQLEEFYPSSVSIRKIKDMPYCFWAKQMSYSKFMMDWGNFGMAQYVQPKQTYSDEMQKPFYADYISDNVLEGNVELIRYYNKDNDEYVIIANGIWLNPIQTGKEETAASEISPLPFNHKQLPFYDVKFDFYGTDFFYGKSLPDRLKSLQDVLNVLNNMLLDQSFLSIFAPILTSGFDPIEDDYLRPGRRIPIDTQGLPLNQAVMRMDVGTPSGWHQYILDYTKKIMEDSSLDQVSSGTAGVGGRTTAAEIRTAADGVSSMLGLFGRMINYGIKRKALFKSSNALQFWTDANSPMIEKIMGEGGTKEMNEAFNTFKVDNTVLTSGKRGTKIIEMYQDTEKMPTKAKQKARSLMATSAAGHDVEFVAINAEYLREFQYDVKIVPGSKNDASRDIAKALQLEKVRVYMTFFPNQIDINELAAQTAEKMGDDPMKVLKSEVFNPPAPAPAAAPGQGTPGEGGQTLPTAPSQNTAGNAVQGSLGEMRSMNDLSELQNSMTG